MRDPEIFADAFNQFLYHGRQVLRPGDLTEVDSTEITVPYGAGGAGVPEQKYRDVLKLAMMDGGIIYCILGCENQSGVHYAMPVKNMAYDAMQLSRQVAKAAKSHRKGRAAGDGEFLSGFCKADRLVPVVTLTVYWGPGKWDGPLSLKEMYAPADGAIMEHVPDYRVNLVAPGQMPDEAIMEFKTSLKEVMLYIKYSRDKARLLEIAQSEPGFRRLDRQAAEVINLVTNSKLKYSQGEGKVDMCLAIEEMRNDSKLEGRKEGRKEGRVEGRIEGAVETYREVGVPQQETVQRIADKFSISMQQAAKEVKKYWK